ncbi:hypothetical protein OUZ56_022412 [Daphnia magna]|uniref:Uncharacterized protein n=1 Tax=Daphnia magna TaxID=35525 RepID=A0ABR0AWA4_9CRUS|nr:hypothetical protein OUZ56_022412 [Daphnia magna]
MAHRGGVSSWAMTPPYNQFFKEPFFRLSKPSSHLFHSKLQQQKQHHENFNFHTRKGGAHNVRIVLPPQLEEK